MCGSHHRLMLLGGFLFFRHVSMKFLWWLALASMIRDAFQRFSFSVILSTSSSSSSLLCAWVSSRSPSMSLVPSMVSSRIPSRSRFSNELDRSCTSISSSLGVGVRWSLGVSFPGTVEVPVALSLVGGGFVGVAVGLLVWLRGEAVVLLIWLSVLLDVLVMGGVLRVTVCFFFLGCHLFRVGSNGRVVSCNS